MSHLPWQKFRGRFRHDERFLNIFSEGNTFNLMARSSFVPVYKGRNCRGMVLGQHAKIFFNFRQKTTNGLMAFCNKNVRVGFLALRIWLDGNLQRAPLRGLWPHRGASPLPR
jgi:hypothetical protein